MPFSLEEISQHPVVVVLYNSGSSGEFLAYALSQTINQFSKTTMTWENGYRVKFQDYFGRSLIAGDIDTQILSDRVSLYFENLLDTRQWHMGLAHCNQNYMNFLSTIGRDWPVLEIVAQRPRSVCFRKLSTETKVHNRDPKLFDFQMPEINLTSLQQKFKFNKHIQIEWQDFILDDPENSYKQVLEFLGGAGNSDQFLSMVDDYRKRNHKLIEVALDY